MKSCVALLFLAASSGTFAQSPSTTPYSFTTLAGSASIGSTDGAGNVARFNFPGGVAVDSAGNLYVADSSNHTLRKISAAGVVSTLAGKAGYPIDPSDPQRGDGTGANARFSEPAGVTVDAAGNVFVAGGSDNAIRKVTPAGVVTTVAGGGPLSAFNVPEGIAVDATGTLYVADTYNCAIKKVTPAGVVTTLAGGSLGTADGTGAAAQFSNPRGIAVDATGTIYVADTANHTIRKITQSGAVTTFAGTAGAYGHVDGMGTAAQFDSPSGLTLDVAGNLYVADYGNATVRKITPSGAVTTVAGAIGMTGHVDGNFPVARFLSPQGIAADAAGNLFVADARDQTIRKVTPAAVTSTVAGLSPLQSNGSASGAGGEARFSQPGGVAAAPNGDIYLADTQNHAIRKIAPNGFVVTFAGAPDNLGYAGGSGAAAQFDRPVGVAVDAAGNVFVADNGNWVVRKITPAGTVTTVAGRPGFVGTIDGPPGTAAFGSMMGLAVRPNGNLIVSESNVVREVTPDGAIRSLAVSPSSPSSYFGGVAVDPAGNVDVLDVDSGQIVQIAPSGSVTRISPNFVSGYGIAVDRAGNIFVTGRQSQLIWRLSIDGVASVIGGLTDVPGSSDGVGSEARFYNPSGVAVDPTGNIYVTCSDFSANTLRKGQPAGIPVITSQPQSQTVARGASVQLSVTATGFPAPSYQWALNGARLGSATASTLTLANIQSTDAGDYTVVVTNPAGSVTSDKATLTLASAPDTPSPSSGGSGGGGAPSLWFTGALLFLAIRRLRSHRGNVSRSIVPHED